jgi:hypothetical protein
METDAGKNPRADHTWDETAPEIGQESPQIHKETPTDMMDRRHRNIAQRAQKKAIDALARIDPEDMTANEARQLLKTAQDIERRVTEGHRDPDRQREDVKALLASVWEAAKRG